MSSLYVRDKVLEYIEQEVPSEIHIVDLSADFEEMRSMLSREGITGNTPWLGLQYIGNDETPVSISATNKTGKYRELGAVYLHVVEKARIGIDRIILQRGEILRSAFRGARIEDILIESVQPINFSTGATINFEGGYTSGSIIIGYRRDFNI